MQQQQQNLNVQLQNCEASFKSIQKSVNQLIRPHPRVDPTEHQNRPSIGDMDIIRVIESSLRIHQLLFRFRSEMSPVLQRSAGIKRRFADLLTKEPPRDKRFSKRLPLDKLKDLKASLVIFMFGNYFKLSNCDDVFAYEGPLGSMIKDVIGRQVLTPALARLLEQLKCPFYDGCVLIEVHDHRIPFNTSARFQTGSQNNLRFSSANLNNTQNAPIQFEIKRFMARPATETLLDDCNQLQQEFKLDAEQNLELESKILASTEVNICLDPSPEVARIASVIEYNKRKFLPCSKRFYRPKPSQRSSSFASNSLLSDGKSQFERVLSIPAPQKVRSFESQMHPMQPQPTQQQHAMTFKQISFIQDWRMNKSSAEAVPLVCLDPNITKKLMPSARRNSKGSAASGAMGFTESPNALFSGGVLQPSSPNRQLIRTLKFVKKFNSKDEDAVYTTLNIYATIDGTFEAQMCWGQRPDTSVNGGNLKFTTGDLPATEAYVRHFLSLYVSCENHALQCDVRCQPDFPVMTTYVQQQPPPSVQSMQQPPPPRSFHASASVGQPLQQQQQQQYQSGAASPPYNPSLNNSRPSSPFVNTLQQRPGGGFVPIPQQLPQQQQPSLQQPGYSNAPPVAAINRSRSTSSLPSGATLSASPQLQPSTASASPQLIGSSDVPVVGDAPAIQQSQQQQQQHNVKVNTEFLQRLLRLPYNQVPEQHRSLYLQIKQRITQQQQARSQQQQQLQQQQQAQQQQFYPSQPQQPVPSQPTAQPQPPTQPQPQQAFTGGLTLQQQQAFMRQLQQQQQQQQKPQ